MNLHKTYSAAVTAANAVNLTVDDGEFVTLLGPSGSGKTTLLMMIGGFEAPTSGSILAGGVDVTRTPPERRNLGVVFQSYALFPNMTVAGNIAYPLEVRGMSRSERRRAVAEALDMVDLAGLGERRPAQLSGGQQQRVALARALVYRPKVLLLDEPFGALDRALRERMQSELKDLHQRVGVTFVYVTHDQDEALTMSDRIVVMRRGSVEQIGTPEEIYLRPATRFVAGFVGTANLIPCEVMSPTSDGYRVLLNAHELTVRGGSDVTDQGALLLRPEKASVAAGGESDGRPQILIEGRVATCTFAGSGWRYTVNSELGQLTANLPRKAGDPGERLVLGWSPADAWLIGATQTSPEHQPAR